MPGSTQVSAANHYNVFKNVGITPVDYPYYDPRTFGLNFEGFKSALGSAPPGSVILLHACAHNPTGVDPTREQWKELAELISSKHHYAFFDCAYQGFASGDLDYDAWAVRYFVEKKIPMLVCQVWDARPHSRPRYLHGRFRALQRMLGCTASALGHSILSPRARTLRPG